MEGTPENVERELLTLLWRLMGERDELPLEWSDQRDQIDLQIVRCLALLALVRNPPEEPDEDQTTP
jgi:hypothetical protein